jgi:hypothetical protein
MYLHEHVSFVDLKRFVHSDALESQLVSGLFLSISSIA